MKKVKVRRRKPIWECDPPNIFVAIFNALFGAGGSWRFSDADRRKIDKVEARLPKHKRTNWRLFNG